MRICMCVCACVHLHVHLYLCQCEEVQVTFVRITDDTCSRCFLLRCLLTLASLYFIAYTDKDDNELLTLEIIHHYVEILDRYFGNVCELDIIFNFHKAYYLLDETVIAGELQETSKQKVLHATVAQDMLIKAAGEDRTA